MTAALIIIGILALLIQWAFYKRKKKYYRLRIGTLQRDYNDIMWKWSNAEADFDKFSGKIIAESDNSIKKIDAMKESVNLYQNENKLLREELDKIKAGYITMRAEVDKQIQEQEDLDTSISAKHKVSMEIVAHMGEYMEVVDAYQHMLLVPEVKEALLKKGEESLKNLTLIQERWTKVSGMLTKAMESHLPNLKKKVEGNPCRPVDAVNIGIRDLYDELDFEQKIQVLEAECPDFISTQEDLINSIDIMIRVKALDHPLINYEESSDSLKQVKRLYEKLNFIIEDAKAKHPEWLTLKN
jgi:hypothetical protein